MAVVGAKFLRADQQVELIYEDHSFSSDKVRDAQGNLLFKIRHSPLGGQVLIEDAASDSLLLLLDRKMFSFRGVWQARDAHNRLLFTLTKASMLQSDLSVFIGSEDVNRAPDYIILSKAFSRSRTIVRGDNGHLVAKMEFPHIFTPDFTITASPGADLVLVTAMFTIANEKRKARNRSNSSNT